MQAILGKAATLELGSAGMQAVLGQAATFELDSAGMHAILEQAATLELGGCSQGLQACRQSLDKQQLLS
jgi:hypothetical protein